jgi:hypothetical protein
VGGGAGRGGGWAAWASSGGECGHAREGEELGPDPAQSRGNGFSFSFSFFFSIFYFIFLNPFSPLNKYSSIFLGCQN